MRKRCFFFIVAIVYRIIGIFSLPFSSYVVYFTQYMIATVKKYLFPYKGNDHKPHLLREGSITVLFSLVIILFCTSLGSSYVLNKTDFGAAVLPAVLVDLTNEHRIENNQKPLVRSTVLEAAALMKAKDMAANQYFAHTSPAGITPWYWFNKAGYKFSYAGENLAVHFTESSDVERAWIASPTHHANLINSKFDEIGIATYDGVYEGQPTTFVVQLFGKPVALPVTPAAVVEKKVAVSTQPLSAPIPEVKGESVAPVLIVEEPRFAVAQNIAVVSPEELLSQQETPQETKKYASLVGRVLVQQAQWVQYLYLALMLLVYIALIGMVVFEFRVVHIKNIMLGVLLLCLLGILAYANSGFVLSFG
jgi:hypothetical protein